MADQQTILAKAALWDAYQDSIKELFSVLENAIICIDANIADRNDSMAMAQDRFAKGAKIAQETLQIALSHFQSP